MKKIIIIIILTSIYLISCKNETQTNKNLKVTKTKKNDNEKTNIVFIQFKELYNELNTFKNTENFKKYGFSKDGINKTWLEKTKELKNHPNSKLLLKKGILISELEQLGMAYSSSKGEETEVTKTFNKIFTNAISQNKESNKSIKKKKSTSKKWYSGGSLHRANGNSWKRASEHNKLATCADFVMTIAKRNGETPSVSSPKYKKASKSLKKCIDKFYKLHGSTSTKVSKAAISCL